MDTNTAMKTCPDCRGAGCLWINDHGNGTSCPRCLGYGEVEFCTRCVLPIISEDAAEDTCTCHEV